MATIEHDIWSSADAAARVREATGGDETVPAVFVGPRVLVNPSVRRVIDAISVVDPGYRPFSTPAPGRGGSDGAKQAAHDHLAPRALDPRRGLTLDGWSGQRIR